MEPSTDEDRPLVGRDYPWFCPGCQIAVDQCASAAAEGPDQDDPEAACNLAYDLRLLCSTDGMRCAAPPVEWVGQRIERYLGTGDVYECRDCGMHSAFEWRVAEELGIPMVGPRAALEEVMCGHCRTTFGDDGKPIRGMQLLVETLRAA